MPSNHEADSTLGCILFHVPQPLLHKVVVAQVCIRVVRNHREKHHDRQPEQIPCFDGNIERWIVNDPHRPLHPVDNALPSRKRCSAPSQENARVGCQLFQFDGKFRAGHCRDALASIFELR